MSEDCFWRVYFLLVTQKTGKQRDVMQKVHDKRCLLELDSLLAETSDSPLKPDEVDQVNVNLRELLGISPLKLASDSDVHEGQGSQLTAGLGSSVHEQRGGSSDLSRPRQGTPHSPLPSSFGPKVSPDSAREKT
eukprot:scaffold2699_cov376-Prasinococcus_capsulatus_cf.AAC.3